MAPGAVNQILRGFSVGSRGYGYASVPDDDTKYDKKGRLRADGFKPVIVPEEARIVQRIFRDFIAGRPVTTSAKEMNDERVPTKRRLERLDTLADLEDEKYTRKFVWNRTTTAKDRTTRDTNTRMARLS